MTTRPWSRRRPVQVVPEFLKNCDFCSQLAAHPAHSGDQGRRAAPAAANSGAIERRCGACAGRGGRSAPTCGASAATGVVHRAQRIDDSPDVRTISPEVTADRGPWRRDRARIPAIRDDRPGVRRDGCPHPVAGAAVAGVPWPSGDRHARTAVARVRTADRRDRTIVSPDRSDVGRDRCHRRRDRPSHSSRSACRCARSGRRSPRSDCRAARTACRSYRTDRRSARSGGRRRRSRRRFALEPRDERLGRFVATGVQAAAKGGRR